MLHALFHVVTTPSFDHLQDYTLHVHHTSISSHILQDSVQDLQDSL